MNGTLRTARERREGTALLAVVAYLGIVSILSGTFFVAVNRALDRAAAQESREVGRCLAESGVEKALAELRADPGYPGETGAVLGEGTFSVAVERGANGVYRIVSTGARTEGRVVPVTVEVEAELRDGVVSALRWVEEAGR